MAKLKAIELKYNELKVSPDPWFCRKQYDKIILALTVLIHQEEMGQYADNDPAAFEAMS